MSVSVSPDPVLTVLRGARELLTPEGSWCQYHYTLKGGRQRCLSEALHAAWQGAPENLSVIGAAHELLSDMTDRGVMDWNDDSRRTQAEVLDLLDAAIASRESGTQ